MKERIFILLLTICLLQNTFAFAELSSIQTDDYFVIKEAHLLSDKVLTIYLQANSSVSYIGISQCILQKKIDNTWNYKATLPLPTNYLSGPTSYSSIDDYSIYITESGTFRIKVVIYAYRYSTTIYTNARTF